MADPFAPFRFEFDPFADPPGGPFGQALPARGPVAPTMPMDGNGDTLAQMQMARAQAEQQFKEMMQAEARRRLAQTVGGVGTDETVTDPRGLRQQTAVMAGTGYNPDTETMFEPAQRQRFGDLASDMQGYSFPRRNTPETNAGIDALLAENRVGIDPSTGGGPQAKFSPGGFRNANVRGVDRPIVGAIPFDPSVSRPEGIMGAAMSRFASPPTVSTEPTPERQLEIDAMQQKLADQRLARASGGTGPEAGFMPDDAAMAAIREGAPRRARLEAERKEGVRNVALLNSPKFRALETYKTMAGMGGDGGVGIGGLNPFNMMLAQQMGIEPKVLADMQIAEKGFAAALAKDKAQDALAREAMGIQQGQHSTEQAGLTERSQMESAAAQLDRKHAAWERNAESYRTAKAGAMAATNDEEQTRHMLRQQFGARAEEYDRGINPYSVGIPGTSSAPNAATTQQTPPTSSADYNDMNPVQRTQFPLMRKWAMENAGQVKVGDMLGQFGDQFRSLPKARRHELIRILHPDSDPESVISGYQWALPFNRAGKNFLSGPAAPFMIPGAIQDIRDFFTLGD